MTEVLDRITSHLIGLRMPRALEALDYTVRQIERCEITALEAIDNLLVEEFTIHESRRVTVAMTTTRLTPPKTLEGFDFTFHFLGQPGTGKSHLATALGVAAVKAGKSAYHCSLAEIIESLSKAEREGRLTEKLKFYTRVSLMIVPSRA